MVRDIPEIFEGVVEIDETYFGKQWKNKRKSQLRKDKKVYAELLNDTEAKDLIPIITKRIEPGTRICSDTWLTYTELSHQGLCPPNSETSEKGVH